jgi:carotene biosynthesis associated membrane protein
MMKELEITERLCLLGHITSLVFGLAGILIFVPHPELLAGFGEVAENAMGLSMAGGGVVYMILGATAVFLYAKRSLGLGVTLGFLLPSILISLCSELLGTSTGFPFGGYSYLSGLGYKISGLVPFTIPLSWFYLGFVSYLLARVGLEVDKKPSLLRHVGAILLGALLLTSWDFTLDPAMSQTSLPFWYWHQPGAFFGMPYQNFAGWLGTGSIFMTVAALLWKNKSVQVERSQLNFPFFIYLSNFAFATVLSLAAGFNIPVLLGVVLGVVPATFCWWKGQTEDGNITATPIQVASVEVAVK